VRYIQMYPSRIKSSLGRGRRMDYSFFLSPPIVQSHYRASEPWRSE